MLNEFEQRVVNSAYTNGCDTAAEHGRKGDAKYARYWAIQSINDAIEAVGFEFPDCPEYDLEKIEREVSNAIY